MELYNVEAVNRWNPLIIAAQLLSANLLISGGGSLFQDATSIKSLRYYLAVIRLALLLNKKVMIYSQGIGQLYADKSKALVSKALNRCHAITVRDEPSADLLKEIGVTHDIVVTSDPVMGLGTDYFECSDLQNEVSSLRTQSVDKVSDEIRAFASGDTKSPLLMAALRSWKDDSHIAPVAEFLDEQIKSGFDVLLVPTHYPDDVNVCEKIIAQMTEQPYFLNRLLAAREYIALTSYCDYVFSMRLHGLICAFAANTPILGLSYDPKVDAFMHHTEHSEYCMSFDSFDFESANSLIAKLRNMPSQYENPGETIRRKMYEAAWDTARIAVSLLG
jgi:polysaccharide pyruvyl transferase CsaB